MLAHHYLAALELFRSAGVDTTPLVAPARHALREAGDRALVLNAFSAAERYYGAAIDLVAKGDPRWPSLRFKLAQATAPIRPLDLEALGEVVAGFLAAGNVEDAAEVEAYIAASALVRGHRDVADEHLDRAVAFVAEAPLSSAKVRVLAERARFHMLAGDYEGAIRAGQEVLPMAEQLGLDDVRAALLNILGTARAGVGDESGLADLEQSPGDWPRAQPRDARAPDVQQPDGVLPKDGPIGRVRRGAGRRAPLGRAFRPPAGAALGHWRRSGGPVLARRLGNGARSRGRIHGPGRGRIASLPGAGMQMGARLYSARSRRPFRERTKTARGMSTWPVSRRTSRCSHLRWRRGPLR